MPSEEAYRAKLLTGSVNEIKLEKNLNESELSNFQSSLKNEISLHTNQWTQFTLLGNATGDKVGMN